MKNVPNILTACRLSLSFFFFFIPPLCIWFYIIFLICGLTDVFDGYIARKSGSSSLFGARLDSAADMVMTAALIYVLFPVVNLSLPEIMWLALILIIRLASLSVVYIKYKTFAMLHTYGNKLTGISIFLFPILLYFFDSSVLIYIICTVATISAIEEFAIHLTSHKLKADIKSILSH
ncbi:MAG: CDP-alcohol phosphatidyltransferase family protein [Bacillota bacterium]|nr:CDP-alcohol phosphatidyltransferase family protein [Bacillota bacterium]